MSRFVNYRFSKTLMYELWYKYMKQKYADNVKLCYMDTNSFIIHIKTKDFNEDIADDVEKRFYTPNHIVDRPLLTGKNKKGPGLMKGELGGKIKIEFVALRPNIYSYLMDDGNSDSGIHVGIHGIKKAKGTKKCVMKRILKFIDCKNC